MQKIMLDPSPNMRLLMTRYSNNTVTPFNCGEMNFKYCSSGKSALASILAYLRYSGVIEDKMSSVMVPQWIGYEVYKTITEYSFPTIKENSKSRAMIVYHQYGFPQDMDRILDFSQSRKMIVIEDCAHALDSYYKGTKVGTIGDFSIYSFSKFVYCHALGGVGFKDSRFQNFFQDRLSHSSRSLVSFINAIKLISTYNVSKKSSILSVNFTNALAKMSYSRYGDVLHPSKSSINLFEKQIEKEKNIRKSNYQYIRESLSKYGSCDHLEEFDVLPYAIPLMLPTAVSEKVVLMLRESGFESGIYFFDINRFMPEPNFVKTVLIPCHSEISKEALDIMVGIIRRELVRNYNK
jgi:hypothetical protein